MMKATREYSPQAGQWVILQSVQSHSIGHLSVDFIPRACLAAPQAQRSAENTDIAPNPCLLRTLPNIIAPLSFIFSFLLERPKILFVYVAQFMVRLDRAPYPKISVEPEIELQ